MSIDFVSYRLASLPEPNPEDIVLSLYQRLQEAGFTQDGLDELRLIFPEHNQTLTAIFRACERDPGPVSVLMRLFLLSQSVERPAVEEVLGTELVVRLVEWGLLAEVEDKVAASVDIHPCQGIWVATDHQIGPERYMEAVYPLGGDSYILACLTPRTTCQLALDIATGSGVHAILAAAHCESVHGVDIAARPLEFARFNGALNGVRDQLYFFEGDLFSPLPKVQYDLIIANPPWVPTPDEPVELYRSGGGDGEVLTKAVTAAMTEWLARQGWLAMYVEYPKFAEATYIERVREWLGEGQWGIALLNIDHFSNETYVMGQVASHTKESLTAEFERWMRSYESYGIQGMGWAMLYIRKLDPERESWSVEREATFPKVEEVWLAEWLERLDHAHAGPAPAEWTPRLDEGARLWRELGSGKTVVRWPGTCLSELELSPRQGQLAELLDGSRSVESLAEFASELEELRKLALLR